MKCSEVMTSNPKFCLPTDTAFKAAQLMKSEDVGPIPIVTDAESKKLVGIVTDRDLVLKVVAEGLDPKTNLKDVMSTDLFTCRSDDEADKAIELMQEHQVRRVPVVDDGGWLVGIISQADVATRIDEPDKTADTVEEISKAAYH
jgi:CBS domain-containing protein